MARQLTGTVLRIWRAFGRVRFTVRWETGETATITIPKRQIEATIRAGDTVGTILPDPPYTADDLLRWNMWDPSMGPPRVREGTLPAVDLPPNERHYHRIRGAAK